MVGGGGDPRKSTSTNHDEQTMSILTRIASMVTLTACITAVASAQTPADEATAGNVTGLAKQLGLYVFPAKGQSTTQQTNDEAACYNWAVEQTGINPMAPAPNADSAAKVYAEKMNAATQGAAVVGGAKGAAAGTAIGAIAGNTGEGAAIGAVIGGLAGRRARKEAEQEAQVAGAQAAQNKEKQNMATFSRAMTACLT
ncbi:MAG TPA: hypothetical protein PKA66_11220, partial [Gemmatimonadales bacterium]|nr:hypothetical protein [Gemmatimonadales bacterium]